MPTWSPIPLLRPDSWQIGIIPAPACPPGRLSFGVKSRPDELVPSILTDVVKCRLEELDMDMWTCHSPGESANNPNTSLWLSRPLSRCAVHAAGCATSDVGRKRVVAATCIQCIRQVRRALCATDHRKVRYIHRTGRAVGSESQLLCTYFVCLPTELMFACCSIRWVHGEQRTEDG